MVINTGKIPLKMKFDTGEVGIIYINPNDRKTQERIEEFEKKIEKRIKEIELDKYEDKLKDDIGVNVDITNINALLDLPLETLEKVRDRVKVVSDIEKEYNEIVKKEFNEIFKSPVSEVAFKYCEPFDVVVYEENGKEVREPHIIQVLKWLGEELSKNANKNSDAMNKHIAKYTRK